MPLIGFLAGTEAHIGLIRRLRRYYQPVRLPVVVHHRRVSLDLPVRPLTPSVSGDHRLSRFSRGVCLGMLGVSDRRRAPAHLAIIDAPDVAFRFSSQRRRLRSVLSRFNTRPARTPVNASRTAAHDSGRCGSLHNTSPV
jgi:hypothetical protein